MNYTCTVYTLHWFSCFRWHCIVKEASIHVYEKKGCDRVGRGRRREAIAELLKVFTKLKKNYVKKIYLFANNLIFIIMEVFSHIEMLYRSYNGVFFSKM